MDLLGTEHQYIYYITTWVVQQKDELLKPQCSRVDILILQAESKIYSHPNHQHHLPIPNHLFNFPILHPFLIKNKQGTFIQAQAIEVTCQLIQAIFVSLLAAPQFEFNHVLVLVVGDQDIEAFFLWNLWLFKSVAMPVEDWFQKSQKDQATPALQRLAFFFFWYSSFTNSWNFSRALLRLNRLPGMQ